MARKFQRTKEDFTCEQCQTLVIGDGYTNHCPNCLWGKHVDVNPGDRAANCGGMMEPIAVQFSGGEYKIHYRCLKCKFERPNRASESDNREILDSLLNQS